MEIGGDVRREEIEKVIRELMDGEKGKKMREKVDEWGCLVEVVIEYECGFLVVNFEKVVKVFLDREGLNKI